VSAIVRMWPLLVVEKTWEDRGDPNPTLADLRFLLAEEATGLCTFDLEGLLNIDSLAVSFAAY
jgi:hypothetical protein